MKTTKKKIVWLAHEANISGANLCLKEFMQVAAEAGFEQLLILPHSGNMEAVATELHMPFKIIHYYPWVKEVDSGFFDRHFLKRVLRNSVSSIQLVLLLLKNKTNLVFTNTSVIHIGALAALIAGKRHYWYIHEMGEEDFGVKLPWGRFSYWFMWFSSEKILTNSFHLAAKYKKKYHRFVIDVIRYPVPVQAYYPLTKWTESEPVKLLLLGQVAETKGHLVAIEAVALLRKAAYNVQLSIVGKCENDSFKQKLNAAISEEGLGGTVSYMEYTDQPVKVISAHHILLMCSRCEAFGRVTIEAMKAGVPVVGSNTCGTKEIISDRVTGCLFEQGNPVSLSSAIRDLIDDENLRKNITQQAKESAEKLTNKESFFSLLQFV